MEESQYEAADELMNCLHLGLIYPPGLPHIREIPGVFPIEFHLMLAEFYAQGC